MKIRSIYIIPLFILWFFAAPVFAQEFNQDLFINESDVRVSNNILKGQQIRMYVTVNNPSQVDLSGVVKFYDERISQFIAADQPVSVLAEKTDDVYVDWSSDLTGEHTIAIRVVPWNEEGDNPDNNKVVKKIYVDIDSDGDGTGDRLDNDDDNDGVPDKDDAFPLDPNESKDTDGDGIGDNADTDDDNDGISDVMDIFPLDPYETKDADNDGVGDNNDPFPYDPNEWMDSDRDGLGDNADPNDTNHGPIPIINISDTKVCVGKMLTFNALESRDPDGEITDFEWDFGDGTIETGVIIDHIYEKPGDYLVALKVTDDSGEYREQQVQVKVTSNWALIALIAVTILLILLLLGLFHPKSRFYHKKLNLWEGIKKPKKK